MLDDTTTYPMDETAPQENQRQRRTRRRNPERMIDEAKQHLISTLAELPTDVAGLIARIEKLCDHASNNKPFSQVDAGALCLQLTKLASLAVSAANDRKSAERINQMAEANLREKERAHEAEITLARLDHSK